MRSRISKLSVQKGQVQLMKSLTSPSWYFIAVIRNPLGSRLAWNGEVPLIRLLHEQLASLAWLQANLAHYQTCVAYA
jgi:hypothetical protein